MERVAVPREVYEVLMEIAYHARVALNSPCPTWEHIRNAFDCAPQVFRDEVDALVKKVDAETCANTVGQ